MRVIADTNVVVSGSLWLGNPRHVLQAARRGGIDLFTSAVLLAELEEVLARRKFARILSAANVSVREVVKKYTLVATVVEVSPIGRVVLRDPDDDAVIACALSARADIIVSGDNDLLDLKEHRGIRILTATKLLSELKL